MDPVLGHFGLGHWWTFAIYAVIYGMFIAFMPFYKKSRIKPTGAYLAFAIAFALEMFGVPITMYIFTWVLGYALPDGILWGHTLIGYFGLTPTNIGIAIQVIGLVMVIFGWKQIFHKYWSKERSQGELVTGGIYRYIRHPQYTGFLLMTLGMIFEWATLPLLIMWPVLAVIYYRLAKKEEADMAMEFGQQYLDYRSSTGMFLPRLWSRRQTEPVKSNY